MKFFVYVEARSTVSGPIVATEPWLSFNHCVVTAEDADDAYTNGQREMERRRNAETVATSAQTPAGDLCFGSWDGNGYDAWPLINDYVIGTDEIFDAAVTVNLARRQALEQLNAGSVAPRIR